jgi:hypothetical protein
MLQYLPMRSFQKIKYNQFGISPDRTILYNPVMIFLPSTSTNKSVLKYILESLLVLLNQAYILTKVLIQPVELPYAQGIAQVVECLPLQSLKSMAGPSTGSSQL